MKVTMLYLRIMKLIFQKLEIFCQIQNFKHLFYKIRRKIMVAQEPGIFRQLYTFRRTCWDFHFQPTAL